MRGGWRGCRGLNQETRNEAPVRREGQGVTSGRADGEHSRGSCTGVRQGLGLITAPGTMQLTQGGHGHASVPAAWVGTPAWGGLSPPSHGAPQQQCGRVLGRTRPRGTQFPASHSAFLHLYMVLF